VLPNCSHTPRRITLVVALAPAVIAIATTGCAQQPAAPYVSGAPPIVLECSTPYDGARPGPALVGQQYGMQMSVLPLNSVQFDSHVTASRLAVQKILASRTATDTVEVTARLVSCSDYPVALRMRINFLRANEAPAEPMSAWRDVYLSPRAIANYTEFSMARDVNSYIIEIAAAQ